MVCPSSVATATAPRVSGPQRGPTLMGSDLDVLGRTARIVGIRPPGGRSVRIGILVTRFKGGLFSVCIGAILHNHNTEERACYDEALMPNT